jgi:hypothetical protein
MIYICVSTLICDIPSLGDVQSASGLFLQEKRISRRKAQRLEEVGSRCSEQEEPIDS